MELTYRRAALEDLEFLTETRIQVLRAANRLGQDTDMSEVQRKSRDYYRESLANNTHITLEATDMGRPLYEKYGFVRMNDEMELPM